MATRKERMIRNGSLLTLALVAACSGSNAQEKPVVLLPGDPSVRAALAVIPLPSGYTATGQLGGGTALEITAVKAPKRGDAVNVQKTEYGYDASVVRGGGLYNISLQCGKRDKRCADESYIRGLAAGLQP